MLCPTNPNQIRETYIDLLTMDVSNANSCVDLAGKPAETAPDGALVVNPCRRIMENGLAPGSEERRQLIERQVLLKSYNTNYASSWFMVRSETMLDRSGNLARKDATCAAAIDSPNSTQGPLKLNLLDASVLSASTVPLLGDGAASDPLPETVGPHIAGELTVRSYSSGPVRNPEMTVPSFASGAKREGVNGWWIARVRKHPNVGWKRQGILGPERRQVSESGFSRG